MTANDQGRPAKLPRGQAQARPNKRTARGTGNARVRAVRRRPAIQQALRDPQRLAAERRGNGSPPRESRLRTPHSRRPRIHIRHTRPADPRDVRAAFRAGQEVPSDSATARRNVRGLRAQARVPIHRKLTEKSLKARKLSVLSVFPML